MELPGSLIIKQISLNEPAESGGDVSNLNTTLSTAFTRTTSSTSLHPSSPNPTKSPHGLNVICKLQPHHPMMALQPSTQFTASASSSTNKQALPYQNESICSSWQPHSSLTGQPSSMDKLSRPMVFDKMEALVREMQHPEHGVPVRQQKIFLTSIPYAFMGYDLIEWLMEKLLIEESEALNIANQLCLHGYFFPVNDAKTLTVKDDSSLYRFQTPYYWPCQHKPPDNIDYAIYLVKRSLRNKQRHGLEDYEMEALASLHRNLKGKWEIILMQAEEQIRLAKDRKKGDKIVSNSQERAYWRVHRPPPGLFTPLESCPVPLRDRQGSKQNRKKTIKDIQREVTYLKNSLNIIRMKMSQACESLMAYSETFIEYDFFIHPALPSNPWITDDTTFWQLNNMYVDIPTEKRVKRWAISIEELVSDPTGLQEFTTFLEKEYSHENIRFWIAVNRLRRSAHSQVNQTVQEIYQEFLEPGAPCEINIDGKTMESVVSGLKNPSRFTFDAASEHIYMLLLKKDCYPRFLRSDYYKRLLETGIQPAHKRRFFNFGGVSGAKKRVTAALSSQSNPVVSESNKVCSTTTNAPTLTTLPRRRGSDRSLSGSAQELVVAPFRKDATGKVAHSHSQSNLSNIIYRDATRPKTPILEIQAKSDGNGDVVCPWDVEVKTTTPITETISSPKAQVIEVEMPSLVQAVATSPTKIPNVEENIPKLSGTSSENTDDLCENLTRTLVIRHQKTIDSGEASVARLLPHFTEQRRASISFASSNLEKTSRHQPGKQLLTPSTTASTDELITPQTESMASDELLQTTNKTDLLPLNETSPVLIISKEPEAPSNLTEEGELAGDQIVPPAVPTVVPTSIDSMTTALEDITVVLPSTSTTDTGTKTAEEDNVIEANVPLVSTGMITEENESSSDIELLTTEIDSQVQQVEIELIHTTDNIYEQLIDNKGTEKATQDTPQLPNQQFEDVNKESSILAAANDSTTDSEEIKADIPEVTVRDLGLAQGELSPTIPDYQEVSPYVEEDNEFRDYDIIDNSNGYKAPAPTPAPSIAPLAEIDTDTVDDELSEEAKAKCSAIPNAQTTENSMVKSSIDEKKKRRKKRRIDNRKQTSIEDKDKASSSSNVPKVKSDNEKTDVDLTTICPWEDERPPKNFLL